MRIAFNIIGRIARITITTASGLYSCSLFVNSETDSHRSAARSLFASLLIGLLLRQGGTPAVALFISAAMLIMVLTIGAFGPRTKGLALEDISK